MEYSTDTRCEKALKIKGFKIKSNLSSEAVLSQDFANGNTTFYI